MNYSHHAQSEMVEETHWKDEIEIIDILSVVWKWKYLILVGTIVCGLIAALISFNMRKIYSIDMVMRPGILSIGEGGKNVYIDSPQNIKALIESGAFNNEILNFLNENNMKNIPKKLELKVNILTDSDTIKVKYETDDIKQGIVIQNRLSKSLLGSYSKLVHYFKNEYDIKLDSLKSELGYIKTTIQSYKRNVRNIERRIEELDSENILIRNNTTDLIRERNKLLSEKPKEKNILPALVYTNTIQQNLQLSNDYQNEVNNYKLKKEEELQKIEKSEKDITNKLNEIKNLQFKKANIQNIQFLQPPTTSPYSIKPKTILNIALALVAGFLFFVFLSFFLEYLSRHKKS